MPRFFVDHVYDGEIVLTGEDARHITHSLRAKVGDRLTVCCDGVDCFCQIERIQPGAVYLWVEDTAPVSSEPALKVTLYQACPKQDKLSEIVRKGTELGCTEFVPVMTQRCISRANERDFEQKRQRLAKVAMAGAKQSGRGIVPQIERLHSFAQAIERMQTHDRSIILYEEEGGKRFEEINLPHEGSLGILIGSEGGFAPEEVEQAITKGIEPIWLGKRILRCETAPTATLAIVMYLTHNF